VINAQKLKSHARETGIDELRVTTAQAFSDARERINEQVDENLFLNPERWSRTSTQRFCDIHYQRSDARSIITACLCYYTDELQDGSRPGDPHGMVARYTWRNHYLELKNRLRTLARFLKKEYHAIFRVYANGPLAEKAAAQRSGIGFYGKHSIIVHPRFGSWIVLGEIVTDIEIEPDQSLSRDCGTCHLCLDACPTKTIIRPYVIDRRRCIQALTNWPGEIPDDIMAVWGKRLYGCSICQDVCPVNKSVKPFDRPRTAIGNVGPSLSLLDILHIDEKTFRTAYANNQVTASWINFPAIKRNALICLGHAGDRSALRTVREFIRHNDRIIAAAARWALNRL
jgi:epoxyqueuosine reductase